MSDELQQRFERLQRSGDGDWGDVLRRAEKRRGRRRIGVVATLAALAALAAPTAFALHGSIIDFFQSEPAPRHVVVDFAQLDLGAPLGMETEVIAEQTRKIFERRGYDGRVFRLYVAPSRKGGFCMRVDGSVGGGGCGPPYSVPVSPEIAIRGPITRKGFIRGGPVVISGFVGLSDADSIELRYEDGAVDRETLTWVSKPIDAAFFVFDVKPAHWNSGRPKDLLLLDSDGHVLRMEPLHFVVPSSLSSPMDLGTGAPAEALLDQSRKLIAIQTHTGTEAALWVGPTADGRSCYWLRYGHGGFGGGCSAKSFLQPFGLGRSQGKDVVLLWGGPLRQDIAEVEVRYEDGDKAVVRVVDGMALYEIPPAHFPRGHRLYLLMARDAEGNEVARQELDTLTYGSYPCKDPKPLGYGEKSCP